MPTQSRLPNSDGATSNWVASAGADKYSLVNEPIGSPDDDSTYIYRTGVALGLQYLGFASFDISPAAINKVSVTIRAKLNAGGAPFLVAGLVIGGSGFFASSQTISSSAYADYVYEWTTNPVTATAWTESDVESLNEFILRKVGGNSTTRIHATQAYISVDYTTGGGTRRIFVI